MLGDARPALFMKEKQMSQMKKLDEKDLKRILGYYKKGYSLQAIGDKFGVSKTAVRYHLVRMNVKIRQVGDFFKQAI